MTEQQKLEMFLNSLQEQQVVPTLLLHACCAPCASYCIEWLSNYFRITCFFYNPNIAGKEEYEKRRDELKRFIACFPTQYPVQFLEGKHDTEQFYQAVKGLEKEPERGKRCSVCYRMRLEETAKIAKEKKMDYFTTTLSISPLKDARRLNQIGQELEKIYGVSYLVSNFKKRNGYQRSIQLSTQYQLYRQKECGCVFSKR